MSIQAIISFSNIQQDLHYLYRHHLLNSSCRRVDWRALEIEDSRLLAQEYGILFPQRSLPLRLLNASEKDSRRICSVALKSFRTYATLNLSNNNNNNNNNYVLLLWIPPLNLNVQVKRHHFLLNDTKMSPFNNFHTSSMKKIVMCFFLLCFLFFFFWKCVALFSELVTFAFDNLFMSIVEEQLRRRISE